MTVFGVGERVVIALTVLKFLRQCSSQTVAVNPFKDVPVIGDFTNPENEIHDRWWFWVVIALLSLFFFVVAFFTWRGFRNWRRHKQLLQAEEEEAARHVHVETIENGIPIDSKDSLGECMNGGHHSRNASSVTAAQSDTHEELREHGEVQRRTARHHHGRSGSNAPPAEVQMRAVSAPVMGPQFHHHLYSNSGPGGTSQRVQEEQIP